MILWGGPKHLDDVAIRPSHLGAPLYVATMDHDTYARVEPPDIDLTATRYEIRYDPDECHDVYVCRNDPTRSLIVVSESYRRGEDYVRRHHINPRDVTLITRVEHFRGVRLTCKYRVVLESAPGRSRSDFMLLAEYLRYAGIVEEQIVRAYEDTHPTSYHMPALRTPYISSGEDGWEYGADAFSQSFKDAEEEMATWDEILGRNR